MRRYDRDEAEDPLRAPAGPAERFQIGDIVHWRMQSQGKWEPAIRTGVIISIGYDTALVREADLVRHVEMPISALWRLGENPPDPSRQPSGTENPRGEVIAVSGSRPFPNMALAQRYLRQWMGTLPETTVIRTGGAMGIDQLATRLAGDAGLKTEAILPDYDAYPQGMRWKASLDRNETIVLGGEVHGRAWRPADKVLTLWDGVSEGTRDIIDKARYAGIPVAVIGPDGKRMPATFYGQ